MSACTQPLITHSNTLASVLIERGHLACAEQDWAAAHQFYSQALACKGCDAAAAQEASSGLAEVALAEHDLTRAHQLLTQVMENSATSAATRQHVRQLLAH